MKKVLKNLVLVLGCTLGAVALVACNNTSTTHKHSITDEWSKDATKHWHACSGCDELVDKAAHTWGEWVVDEEATETEKGSQHRECTVCEYVAYEDIPMIAPEFGVASELTAVYAQVPADWENVNIYYWGDGIEEGYGVGWPGVAMTLVDAESFLYGYQVPKGTDHVIFNDGSTQTVDIDFAVSKNLYVLDELKDGKYTAYYSSYEPKETDPELGAPTFNKVEKVQLYVQAPADWEKLFIHYWGTLGSDTTWPGAEMDVVDAEKHIFTYEIPECGGLLFHNSAEDEGRVQTGNLELKEGVNAFVIVDANTVNPAKYADGEFELVEVPQEAPVFYVLGSMNGWSANDDYKLVVEGETASLDIELNVGDKFKVATSNWSKEFAFGSLADTTGFVDDNGNIEVAVAGTYTVLVTDLLGNPTCSITLKA